VASVGSTAGCDRSCDECPFVEGEGDFQVQEFNFKLKKIGRTWLIYRIDTVKTLSQTTAFSPSHV